MKEIFKRRQNPISTGLIWICTTVAVTLVLIHVIVNGGIQGAPLIRISTGSLIAAALAGAGWVAGFGQRPASIDATGLPVRV